MRARQWVSLILGCLCTMAPAMLWAEDMRLSSLQSSPYLVPPSRMTTNPVDINPPDPLDQLATQYTTPKAVAEFLHRTFTFKTDQTLFGVEDYWQTPQEFLARTMGDCEDYAILAVELLRRNGIEAHLFSLFGEEGYAHTVCVFLDAQGRYNILNQDKLRMYHAQTLEALACIMCRTWTFGGITEKSGTRGRLVKEITNPHPVSAMASLGTFPASGFNR